MATFRALAKGDLGADAALASAGGLPAAAGVADAAPATVLKSRGAVLREGAALPRLSGFSSPGARRTAADVTAPHQ